MESTPSLTQYFGADLARRLGSTIRKVYPRFDLAGFVDEVDAKMEGLELKERVLAIMESLRRRLPADYRAAIKLLVASLGPELPEGQGMFTEGWYLMPVARMVEEHGLDHFDVSMAALQEITKRHTAEYALRPFLLRYPERTLKVLHEWTRHSSPNVRRLVTEGTRPRLPWAKKLDSFIRDPSSVLALLEELRSDPSPFVQKSVANNLNDIARDHPERILQLAERWSVNAPEATQRILRHGLRNLVKAGNPRALKILGAEDDAGASVAELRLAPDRLPLGETLEFSFKVRNRDTKSHRFIVDYRLVLVRGRGKLGAKVFKIATIELGGRQTRAISKRHSFKAVRVRAYYPGTQRLEILVNGQTLAQQDFELT